MLQAAHPLLSFSGNGVCPLVYRSRSFHKPMDHLDGLNSLFCLKKTVWLSGASGKEVKVVYEAEHTAKYGSLESPDFGMAFSWKVHLSSGVPDSHTRAPIT